MIKTKRSKDNIYLIGRDRLKFGVTDCLCCRLTTHFSANIDRRGEPLAPVTQVWALNIPGHASDIESLINYTFNGSYGAVEETDLSNAPTIIRLITGYCYGIDASAILKPINFMVEEGERLNNMISPHDVPHHADCDKCRILAERREKARWRKNRLELILSL